MPHVKGYKGNKATRKAYESLGWVESSVRSIAETDDGGIALEYDFGPLGLYVRIDPDGRIHPSITSHDETLVYMDLYPPEE